MTFRQRISLKLAIPHRAYKSSSSTSSCRRSDERSCDKAGGPIIQIKNVTGTDITLLDTTRCYVDGAFGDVKAGQQQHQQQQQQRCPGNRPNNDLKLPFNNGWRNLWRLFHRRKNTPTSTNDVTTSKREVEPLKDTKEKQAKYRFQQHSQKGREKAKQLNNKQQKRRDQQHLKLQLKQLKQTLENSPLPSDVKMSHTSKITAIVTSLRLSTSPMARCNELDTMPILIQWYRLGLHIGWYRYKDVATIIAYRRRRRHRRRHTQSGRVAVLKKRKKGEGKESIGKRVSGAMDRYVEVIRAEFRTASDSWRTMLAIETARWVGAISTVSSDWRTASTSWQPILSAMSDDWNDMGSKLSNDWQFALSKRVDNWENTLGSLLALAVKVASSVSFASTLTCLKVYSITPLLDVTWVVICGAMLPLMIRRLGLSMYKTKQCTNRPAKGDQPTDRFEEIVSLPDDSDSSREVDSSLLNEALLTIITVPTTALLKLRSTDTIDAIMWTTCLICLLVLCFHPRRVRRRGRRGRTPLQIGTKS